MTGPHDDGIPAAGGKLRDGLGKANLAQNCGGGCWLWCFLPRLTSFMTRGHKLPDRAASNDAL